MQVQQFMLQTVRNRSKIRYVLVIVGAYVLNAIMFCKVSDVCALLYSVSFSDCKFGIMNFTVQINKSFSGGRDTAEEQRKHGANIEVWIYVIVLGSNY